MISLRADLAVQIRRSRHLLRQALAVFQELKLAHEIKKAEELLEKCKL